MKNIIFTLLLFAFFVSCKSSKKVVVKDGALLELEVVQDMMAGTFSSEAQSIQDTTYFNINLVMHPIWSDEQDSRWLYVEQAVSSNLKTPYRQRVYQLSLLENGVIASKVYELPEPNRFVHAWENEKIFDEISPSSLIVRQGCAVYLSQDGNGCYTGQTKDQECLSSLRGATYATSIVSVCADRIDSWDQGWNAEGEQVWGAMKAGYIFNRK